jgi:hypothetical protein
MERMRGRDMQGDGGAQVKDESVPDHCTCFRDLTETDKFAKRPVFARYLRRINGVLPHSPTEEEKSDAIRVLRDADLWADAITDEAERIFVEASE